MSHTMEWLVDKRVLYIVYDGDVGQAELIAVNEELGHYLEEGITPIHVISDNSNTQRMNMNLKTIQKSFTVLTDKRWGTMCVIGANTIVKFFATLVANAFRLNVKMLATLDEAQAFLAEKDDTLPPHTS